MAFENIAIIGAGLCGLSLAIALQRQGIKTTVYEGRSDNFTSTLGGVMLAPNGLRSLDALGVYGRIKDKSYRFDTVWFHNNDYSIADTFDMGGEKYGYGGMRIYRQVLLAEMKKIAEELGVKINWQSKFSHVVSDGDDGSVRFAMTNGDEHTADVLIGADGVHSAVRKHLYPDVQPAFSGVMSVITSVPTDAVKWPDTSLQLPVSMHSEVGAFIMAPQGSKGEDLLFAKFQMGVQARDRAGWDALWNDKQQLYDLMRQGYEKWNPAVQSALDAVNADEIYIWPFLTVPRLDSWASKTGKVVILGDAAHAVPPATGQGINQGFEDVHTLSLLMSAARERGANWNDCLEWWQQYRQARCNFAADLTIEMTKRRLPGYSGEGESLDMTYLFKVQVEHDVQAWLAGKRS